MNPQKRIPDFIELAGLVGKFGQTKQCISQRIRHTPQRKPAMLVSGFGVGVADGGTYGNDRSIHATKRPATIEVHAYMSSHHVRQ